MSIRWLLAAFAVAVWTVFDTVGARRQSNPVLLGEGIVSTDLNEFGGSLSPAGDELYFSVSVQRSYAYAICVSRTRNNRWQTPEVVSFSGIARDFDPVLSPNGRRLFFASDRAEDGRTAVRPDVDLWSVDRGASGAWGRPKRLPAPINDDRVPRREWFASAASDGTLYFAATGPDGQDLFIARPEAASWSRPQPIGAPVDGPGLEGEPMVDPEQRFLVFSAYERAGGFGDWDLYIAFRTTNGWTDPTNLGPTINSAARDYSPRLAPDGHTLIFTSERHFATPALPVPVSFAAFVRGLRGNLNGNGNIYSVDLRAARLLL